MLLVGGGTVAARKASLLHRAGAVVTVIAPRCGDALRKDVLAGGGRYHARSYQQGDFRGFKLVIAATPNAAVNQQISREADAENIPVNVVDDPALCSFIFPAIVDRAPITVAISSGGASPVLARSVRSQIEAMLPARFGQLARFAGERRDKVKGILETEGERRRFWERVLQGPLASQVLAGQENRAIEQFEHELAAEASSDRHGEVYLIGAGPGDPDLMTFKGLRLLQAADVVLHDRLVSDEIVDLARRDAERIYVGKARSEHAVPQPEINQLLLDLALQGKRVARLKGGDPFVFGRGGEELELLVEHHIPFQVVPGITAATGAASYAGIPLTHRDHAQSVRFVAGYLKGNSVEHDWGLFKSTNETLVFYMGLAGLEQICTQLVAHGRDPATPVALIERATLPSQRVIIGTLGNLVHRVAQAEPRAPTLIVVGDVVRLCDDLSWFGAGPEHGFEDVAPG